MRSFNNIATETIPIRLVMSVAVIGVISLLFTAGLLAMNDQVEKHRLQKQINDLEVSLSILVEMGSPRDITDPFAVNGSRRTFTFDMPSDLLFFSFGGDPTTNETLNKIESNHLLSGIFFQLQGYSKQVIWFDSKCKFISAQKNGDSWRSIDHYSPFVIRRGGSLSITFELIIMNNERFILVYSY